MTNPKRSKKNKAITPSDGDISVKKHFSDRKRTILIIDDDPVVRDVFRIIFESAGYEVRLEGDGHEILNNKFANPDLFLIDKLLSGVNGLDVCRHLKSQGQTKNIPIIMISASPGLAKESRDAGADDYIEKPFDRVELLNAVDKNIRAIEKRRHNNQLG